MADDSFVLIGIDVGMTCTGVAWACKNRSIQMPDPHVIQRWPGNAGVQSDKVATVVGYSNGQLSCWGFLAAHTQDDPDSPLDLHEWFEVYLDPEAYTKARGQGRVGVPSSHEDVRRSYRDFLTKLYGEIERQLADKIGTSWSRANIEFLFSVPTTWTSVAVINDFKKLVQEAGFGEGSPCHSCSVSLTEAEAAAVHTFKAGPILYSDGDILLVVDAGGGTTDLALLKAEVPEQQAQRPKLKQLDQVRGDEIGSVEIDMGFHKLAESRLKLIQRRLRRSADDVAWDMTRHEFHRYKVEFGTEHSDNQNIKSMRVPGLGEDFDAPEAGIRNGKMRFTNANIQALFDVQLIEIFQLIDYQMSRMGQVARDNQITHLVLSGGLGSSEYIKRRLKERYTNTSTPNPFAKALIIATSDAPQLAVAKGLVQDRLQKLQSVGAIPGVGVLATRICRISLGVICFQKYDETKHRGQTVIQDPINGKKYVEKRINWFIKQGQVVSEDAISYKFYRLLGKDGWGRMPWTDEIAISQELKHLPNSMFEYGARILCKMQSDLTLVPLTSFEKKKRSWWQFWKEYQTHYRAHYEIKFRLQPAGVGFELWFNGRRYDDGSRFGIEWAEGAQLSSPREHRRAAPEWSR